MEEETVGVTRVVPTTQTRTQRGQDTSDRLHQTEKYIITKARNKIGDKVIETLMKKCLVCEKMSDRVVLDRKRRTDERDRKYLALLRMIQPTRRTWNPPDDEGFQDERDICQGGYTRE